MASLADIMRQRYGGMVWDTSGDISHESEPMPGVSKAPDVSGLQWFGSTNGFPEMFPPQAMTYQPQGLLDMIAGRPDAPPSGLPANPHHGQIVSANGKNYQWVQMSGDIGGRGSWGWQETTQQPRGLLDMVTGRPDAPLATGPDRFAGVAPMPRPYPIKPDTYVIRKGDTLERIAKRFGTTVKALAAKNGIKNVNRIKAGATLTL